MMSDLFDVQAGCLEIVMQCQQGCFSFHELDFQCPAINLSLDLLIIILGLEHFRIRKCLQMVTITLLDDKLEDLDPQSAWSLGLV